MGLQVVEGAGVDEGLQGPAVELLTRDAVAQLGQRAKGAIALAGLNQLAYRPIPQIADRRKAKQDAITHRGEVDPRCIHIRRHHFDAHGVAVGDIALHLVAGSGIHREQRRHIGHRIVGLEIGGLVGHSAIGRGMAFVEAVLGKQHHLLKQGFRNPGIDAPLGGTIDKLALVLLHLTFLLLAHGAAQQVRFTQGITGQLLGDLHDLLLVDHDSVGFLQNRLQFHMGEINRFAPMLAVDKFWNQAGI